MSETRWSGFNINLGEKSEREARPVGSGEPFRILLAGDFSGRASRKALETGRALGARKPFKIDPEGLDQALERMRPAVTISDPAVTLEFRELQDFHPDQIFHRVPRLQELNEADESETERASTRRPPSGFLDQILSGNLEAAAAPAPSPAGETAQSALRKILRHDGFRALERAWRSADFLMRRLELEGDLSLHILDVSKEEMQRDLLETEEIEKSGLFDFLVTRTVGTPGQIPWTLFVLVDVLEPTAADAEFLARLAMVASIAKTTVLAGAPSQLVGCRSFGANPDPDDWTDFPAPEDRAFWKSIRSVPEIRYVGLAQPRVLLRHAYGRKGEEIDSFKFEELESPLIPETLLWGPGALAPALLLAESFLDDGWSLHPGSRQEITGLPFFTVEEDGEPRGVPCSEAYFTMRAAEEILEAGLMPLISLKETDTVRLARIQSFATPLSPLKGRWT